MKRRDGAKRIALAAVGGAFSLVAVTLAFYIKNMSLSFNCLAALGIMLPMSKKYYRESILMFIAVSGIGAIYTTVHILPFVLVTGSYTIAALIQDAKKVKAYITVPVAIVYSCFTFFIFFYLTKILYVDFKMIDFSSMSKTGVYLIMNAIYTVAFLGYHFIIIWLFRYLKPVFNKISGSR